MVDIPTRRARLQREHEQLKRLKKESRFFDFEVIGKISEEPPECYRAIFKCKGIVRIENEKPIAGENHRVKISLLRSFPEVQPKLEWETPIWHPNINPKMREISIDSLFWTEGRSLYDLCLRIGEMIMYKRFNYHNKTSPFPINPEAAVWCDWAIQQKIIPPPNGKGFDSRTFLGSLEIFEDDKAGLEYEAVAAFPSQADYRRNPDMSHIPFPIFLHKEVEREMVKHSLDGCPAGGRAHEVGGLLAGKICRLTAIGERFIRIDHCIPCREAVGDLYRVELSPGDLAKAFDELDEFIDKQRDKDIRCLGWYHSHPGHTVFLSENDEFIHRNFYREPWQVAFVVDPLNEQAGFFGWNHLDHPTDFNKETKTYSIAEIVAQLHGPELPAPAASTLQRYKSPTPQLTGIRRLLASKYSLPALAASFLVIVGTVMINILTQYSEDQATIEEKIREKVAATVEVMEKSSNAQSKIKESSLKKGSNAFAKKTSSPKSSLDTLFVFDSVQDNSEVIIYTRGSSRLDTVMTSELKPGMLNYYVTFKGLYQVAENSSLLKSVTHDTTYAVTTVSIVLLSHTMANSIRKDNKCWKIVFAKRPELKEEPTKENANTEGIIKDTLRITEKSDNDKYSITIRKTGQGKLSRIGKGFPENGKFVIGIEGFYHIDLKAKVLPQPLSRATYFYVDLPVGFSADGEISSETEKSFTIEFSKKSRTASMVDKNSKFFIDKIEIRATKLIVSLQNKVSLKDLDEAVNKKSSTEVEIKFQGLGKSVNDDVRNHKNENNCFRYEIKDSDKLLVIKYSDNKRSQNNSSRRHELHVKEITERHEEIGKEQENIKKISKESDILKKRSDIMCNEPFTRKVTFEAVESKP